MTETTPSPNAPDWLLEPPKPNEARIYIYVGSEAELMPEVREALDHLSAVLRGDEVQGYSFGYSLSRPGQVPQGSTTASRLGSPPLSIDTPTTVPSLGAGRSGPSPSTDFKVYVSWL